MCVFCKRIEKLQQGEDPHFIHEFKHSIFVVGDHQFYQGYSQLILKQHVEDVTDLPSDIQTEYMQEVMLAGKVLKSHFKPYRLNYSCLGNFVEHVHYHIFPRYPEDLKEDDKKNPWWNNASFGDHNISTEQALAVAKEIKESLNQFL